MTRRKNSFWFPLLGLGFAVAGADKLIGANGYRRLFHDWGWSDEAMKIVGATEFAGGVLVSSTHFRRYGGMLLAGVSGAMLSAELQRQQTDLALPRFALLLASAAALFV